MPYNLSLSLSKTILPSMQQDLIHQGTVLYLNQNDRTIGSRILTAYLEDECVLLERIENILFVTIARMFAQFSRVQYEQVNVAENLHIRVESISNGKCIYDSCFLRISSWNKTLSCGTSEKSFISFVLTHCALWKKHFQKLNYDPNYMYRKYLHLGEKAPSFIAIIEHPGSILWHAIYSDVLPIDWPLKR